MYGKKKLKINDTHSNVYISREHNICMSDYFEGSDTSLLLKTIKQIKTFIPSSYKVKRNPILTVNSEGKYHLSAIRDTCSFDEVAKGDVRVPDIVITSIKNNIKAIIEMDGSVHGYHAKKTSDRNDWYNLHNFPLIVVDQEELDYDKIPYIDYIKEKLKEMGVIE